MEEPCDILPLEILDLIIDEVEVISWEWRTAAYLFAKHDMIAFYASKDPHGSPMAKLRLTNRYISDRVRYRMWRNIRLYFADFPGAVVEFHSYFYSSSNAQNLLALLNDATLQPPLASLVRSFTCITFLHSKSPVFGDPMDLFAIMSKLAATPNRALRQINFDSWCRWPTYGGYFPQRLADMISDLPDIENLTLRLSGYDTIPLSTFKRFRFRELALMDVTLAAPLSLTLLPSGHMDLCRIETLSLDDVSLKYFSLLMDSKHLRHLTLRFDHLHFPSDALKTLTFSSVLSLTLELGNRICNSPRYFVGIIKRFPNLESFGLKFLAYAPLLGWSVCRRPTPIIDPFNHFIFQDMGRVIKNFLASIEHTHPDTLTRLNFDFRIYTVRDLRTGSLNNEAFANQRESRWQYLDNVIFTGIQNMEPRVKVSLAFSMVLNEPITADYIFACQPLMDNFNDNMRWLFKSLDDAKYLDKISVRHDREPIFYRPLGMAPHQRYADVTYERLLPH
ncbi:hypothetical protein CPC08DRAFT_714119 [Agrocybe pediades]|nr:hypothetical protein CPC08DRAFT_714119 [Agrocybe pediades]